MEVKKADELKSIADLALPYRTINHLTKHEFTPVACVNLARYLAIDCCVNPRCVSHKSLWQIDLATAANRAGYIRHDVFPGTYYAVNLYRALFQLDADVFFEVERYENCEPLRPEQAKQLSSVVDTLPERYRRVITCRYLSYLFDREPLSIDATAKEVGLNPSQTRRACAKALRMLRSAHRQKYLPVIWGIDPKDYQPLSERGDTCWLEELSLSAPTYQALRKAGLRTAADIMRNPNLTSVPGIGPKEVKEIESCVHDFGRRCLDFQASC